MTRTDDIRSRLAAAMQETSHTAWLDWADDAPDDIRWLLARVDTQEQRILRLEAALRALLDEVGGYEGSIDYWNYTTPNREAWEQARAVLAQRDGDV